MTLVSSLGAGLAATAAALEHGTSGLRPCAFETVTLETYVGAVEGIERHPLRPDLASFECRNNRIAQMALESDGFAAAVAAARDKYGPRRIGVFLGTSTSGILQAELAYRRRAPETGALPGDFVYAKTHNTFSIADFVSRYLRLDGPAVALSSACASTAKVFANAARMIAAGVCDAAVVGGADSLCLTTLYGFHALALLSTAPCRPFDIERDGISIGEGAGFALLEKPSAAMPSDAVMLLGVGESSDAYHMSTPHPEGLGARLAMERALAAAGLAAPAVDYVNLHGTATKVGDASEDQAVVALFGREVPCSSTKGYTGHMLGAAGIAEAIIAALVIRNGLLPGSPQTRRLDPALKCNYRLETAAARVKRVMSNSFGFGGSNCSLVLASAG